MIDSLDAKNTIDEYIKDFTRNHGKSPMRIRVGGELFFALVAGPHSGLVDVDGVTVYFDPTLSSAEKIGFTLA